MFHTGGPLATLQVEKRQSETYHLTRCKPPIYKWVFHIHFFQALKPSPISSFVTSIVKMGLKTFLSLGLLSLVAALPASEVRQEKEYEYIVVGSGAGGGPLASRLAREGHSTLLIEAGDDQSSNPNTTVPIFQYVEPTSLTMNNADWTAERSSQETQLYDGTFMFLTTRINNKPSEIPSTAMTLQMESTLA